MFLSRDSGPHLIPQMVFYDLKPSVIFGCNHRLRPFGCRRHAALVVVQALAQPMIFHDGIFMAIPREEPGVNLRAEPMTVGIINNLSGFLSALWNLNTCCLFLSLCTTEDQPFKNFGCEQIPHVPIWHLVLSCFILFCFQVTLWSDKSPRYWPAKIQWNSQKNQRTAPCCFFGCSAKPSELWGIHQNVDNVIYIMCLSKVAVSSFPHFFGVRLDLRRFFFNDFQCNLPKNPRTSEFFGGAFLGTSTCLLLLGRKLWRWPTFRTICASQPARCLW